MLILIYLICLILLVCLLYLIPLICLIYLIYLSYRLFLCFVCYSLYEDKRLYIYLLHMYAKMVSVSLHTTCTFAISQKKSGLCL